MNRFGVSLKVSSGIGIIVAVTLVAGITALLTLQALQSGYRQVAEHNIPHLVESGKMMGTVRALEAKGVEMAAAQSPVDVSRIRNQTQDLKALLLSGLAQMKAIDTEEPVNGETASKPLSVIHEQLAFLDENFSQLETIVKKRIQAERSFHSAFQTMLDMQGEEESLNALSHLHREFEHSEQGRRWLDRQFDILSALNNLHLVTSRPRFRSLQRKIAIQTAEARAIFRTLDASEQADLTPLNELISWGLHKTEGPLEKRRQLLDLKEQEKGLLNANSRIVTLLVAEVTDLFALEYQEVLDGNQAFQTLADNRSSLMILFSVASLVIAVVIVGYLNHSVLRRLNALKGQMLETMQETGGPQDRSQDRQGDEITEISNVLNHFYEQIQERESRLRRARDKAEQLAVRAEAANRSKSTFLANMSHELRTPLNAIIGFSEIIKSGMRKGAEAEYAEDIHQSGTHLLNLINGILELSKIEAGKHELDHEPVDIRTITQEVQRFFSIPVRDKELTVASEFDGDSIIRISGERADPQYRIRVIDDGVGIDASELEKVMEPFHQAKDGYDETIEGTGLGLAIVRNLVELHGGTLTLESANGQGTVATVTLPVDADNPA